MAKIANVALTNTFDTWRSRSNEAFDRLSQFAINNSSLYANTLTSNTAFTAKGTATVTGLFTASGRATVGTNLTVSGNTTLGGASKTITMGGAASTLTIGGAGHTTNTTGWFGVAGRASVSTNLFVGANTITMGSVGVGTASLTGRLNVTGGTIEFDPGAGADATRALNFNINSNNYGKILIPTASGGAMAFWTGSGATVQERMRISPKGLITACNSMTVTQNLTVSGNTGIGISPTQKLHIYSGSATAVNFRPQNSIAYADFGPQSDGTIYAPYAAPALGTSLLMGTSNFNPIGLWTNGSQRLTIHSYGLANVAQSMIVQKNLTVSGNTIINGTTTDNSNALAQTLTDGATINWDVALGRVATVTLGAAGRTMAAPTNLKVGTYILRVYQDATGSRTITTWNSVFKWTAAVAPVLSTGAGKLDIITFFSDGTNLYGSYLPDMR